MAEKNHAVSVRERLLRFGRKEMNEGGDSNPDVPYFPSTEVAELHSGKKGVLPYNY
jgi:hypothetical protein